MFNVATKSLSAAAAAIVLSLSACNFAKVGDNPASALYISADSAYNAGNYTKAIELLDTLKNRYPNEVATQRMAMHLRPQAVEKQTINEMQQTDSLRAYYTHVQDSLMQYFTLVNDPKLVEGYYVAKGINSRNLFNTTAAEARISPDGEFYMISSLTARPVKHTSIAIKCGSDEVSSSTVAYDGDRNYRSGGTEMITFVGSECDTIGKYLVAHPDIPATLIFKGASNYSMPLPAADRLAIVRTYSLANAIAETKRLELRREFLDKQLQLARDQVARTSSEQTSSK
jgi:hypothetical protein